MSIQYVEVGFWLERKEDSIRVGLSEKGQDDVGEIMFAELPDFEDEMKKGDSLLIVEGTKAVTELILPFSGKITKVHTEIEEDPDLLNSTAQEDNWIIEITDVEDLEEDKLSLEPWFNQNENIN